MNNELDCIEDKKRFLYLRKKLIIFLVLLTFIFTTYKIQENNKIELLNSFNNNQELICSNKIVSKKLNWEYDEKNKRIFKNDDTFLIKNCKRK